MIGPGAPSVLPNSRSYSRDVCLVRATPLLSPHLLAYARSNCADVLEAEARSEKREGERHDRRRGPPGGAPQLRQRSAAPAAPTASPPPPRANNRREKLAMHVMVPRCTISLINELVGCSIIVKISRADPLIDCRSAAGRAVVIGCKYMMISYRESVISVLIDYHFLNMM